MNNISLESYFPRIVSELKGFSIFMLDQCGIILTWNAGCEFMKGYKAAEVIGQNFEILFPDFLREQHLPEQEIQIAKELGRFETENWRRKKNGELFWAFIVITKVTDDKGNLAGYVKITQDQSEKKTYLDQVNANLNDFRNMNIKLDTLNKSLASSNKSLEEFAYASSHDLKAPLRKINSFLGVLKEDLKEHLNEKRVKLFERIEASTLRLVRLINDLLAFSSINQGIGTMAEIDLNVQVKEVLDDLEFEILETSAHIEMEHLPIVPGNRHQFQQMFQNLVSNAIKYTSAGVVPKVKILYRKVTGEEVNVSLPIQMADKTYHYIEVKDNGIGFDQKYAEDIFNVFTRLHNDTEYSGTGIGLSIVQKVVHNHGGITWAESKIEQGTSFKILLPVN